MQKFKIYKNLHQNCMLFEVNFKFYIRPG